MISGGLMSPGVQQVGESDTLTLYIVKSSANGSRPSKKTQQKLFKESINPAFLNGLRGDVPTAAHVVNQP